MTTERRNEELAKFTLEEFRASQPGSIVARAMRRALRTYMYLTNLRMKAGKLIRREK